MNKILEMTLMQLKGSLKYYNQEYKESLIKTEEYNDHIQEITEVIMILESAQNKKSCEKKEYSPDKYKCEHNTVHVKDENENIICGSCRQLISKQECNHDLGNILLTSMPAQQKCVKCGYIQVAEKLCMDKFKNNSECEHEWSDKKSCTKENCFIPHIITCLKCGIEKDLENESDFIKIVGKFKIDPECDHKWRDNFAEERRICEKCGAFE